MRKGGWEGQRQISSSGPLQVGSSGHSMHNLPSVARRSTFPVRRIASCLEAASRACEVPGGRGWVITLTTGYRSIQGIPRHGPDRTNSAPSALRSIA